MLSKNSSSKPGHIHVAFALPDSLWAERVFLVGDFNDWNPTSIPLQRDRSEIWQAELDLPVGGRYAFRYWVDGRWLIDPRADGFTPDACSSLVDTRIGPKPMELQTRVQWCEKGTCQWCRST